MDTDVSDLNEHVDLKGIYWHCRVAKFDRFARHLTSLSWLYLHVFLAQFPESDD